MQSCKSSNVKEYGYCPDTKTLAITYHGGATYHYKNVPAETAAKIEKTESVGKFVNSEIKGKYDFERI